MTPIRPKWLKKREIARLCVHMVLELLSPALAGLVEVLACEHGRTTMWRFQLGLLTVDIWRPRSGKDLLCYMCLVGLILVLFCV